MTLSQENGNLGPGERRKRRVLAFAAFAGAIALIATGWVNSALGWIVLFSLAMAGSLGLFQARGKT